MRIGILINDIQKYICVIFCNIGLNIVDYRVKNKLKKVQKFVMKKWLENRCCEAP